MALVNTVNRTLLMNRTRREFLQVAVGTHLAAALTQFHPEQRFAAEENSLRQHHKSPDLAHDQGPLTPRGGAALLTIEASEPVAAPQPAPLLPLSARAPDGREIGVNSRYLTLSGDPWLPVMGEFHFSRYPEAFWEDELLKMKAGGIQIVATYLFWIHHEEEEGQFDWSGRRNLRRFIELCRKHNLYAFVRIGPWSHGEARNGGFPDWLLRQCKALRRNDPCYLGYVRKYFGQIGEQLSGLYWKDGGLVVGIQLENEYMERGPGAGAEHITELKKIAEESGIKTPLYTVTGWGYPQFPPHEVIPAFAGYPYDDWSRSICELPPSPDYFFSAIRDDQAVAANLLPLHPISPEILHYPFLTAELGGGMETSYHRRPVVQADDVAAMVLCKLGCGANLLGYYVYHGGGNPGGKLSTLQESQATGYPNDVPVISYDYQAPVGEFGQVRPSYGALKVYHLFLRDFGSVVAPMQMTLPNTVPVSIYDRRTPRLAARTDGKRGFVFINNYVRNYPLPEHSALKIELKLPSETLRFPSRPLTIPSGAYSIWPVNLDLNGSLLKYASAQLLCKGSEGETAFYFFFTWPGIEPEFAFDDQSVGSVEATSGVKTRAQRQTHITGINPGSGLAIALQSKAGKTARIVVLTRQQAEACYLLPFGGVNRVFISPAHLFSDGDRLHLRSRAVRDLSFSAFPALTQFRASAPFREIGHDGIFMRYGATVTPKSIPVRVEQRRGAGSLGPPRMGAEVAVAPTDADFDQAGEWRLRLPNDALEGLSELYLRVEYTGDVARLYAGGRLLDDDFYNATVWEIGLKRFASEGLGQEFNLKILPLRENAPIYLPQDSWPSFPPNGEIAEMRKISASPEYEVIVAVA
jgi:hypothetical protein